MPMVVSPVIAHQIQWGDGIDYVASNDLDQMAECCIRLYGDQQLWESLCANSLVRVKAELSPEAFSNSLRAVLRTLRSD